MAMILIRGGNTREARDAYRLYDHAGAEAVVPFCTRHLRRSGADPELYLIRGVAYTEMDGKITQALRDFRKGTTFPAVAPEAHCLLAIELGLQSCRDEAIEHARNAVQLNRLDAYNSWADVLIGEANWAEGYRLTTLAMGSPLPVIKGRAYALRASCAYHLGQGEAVFLQERAEERRWFEEAAKWEETVRKRLDALDGLLTEEDRLAAIEQLLSGNR